MSLAFYKTNTSEAKYVNSITLPISEFVDYDNTLTTYHNTWTGSAVTKRIFLHNSALTKYYNDVIISICGDQINTTTEGYYDISNMPITIKLFKGWIQPDSITWMNTVDFNTLTYNKIGEANSPDTKYYPIWVGIEGSGYDEGLMLDRIVDSSLYLCLQSDTFDFGPAPVNNLLKDSNLAVTKDRTIRYGTTREPYFSDTFKAGRKL